MLAIDDTYIGYHYNIPLPAALFADFEMPTRNKLNKLFPLHQKLINNFTR